MPNTKVPIELSSTPGIIDNSTVTAITIDSAGAATFSGDVGIAGQASPTYKLDGGFANQTWGWYLNSSYNAGFTFNTTERSLLIHTKSAENIDHIKFSTGSTGAETMRISGGKVGIGTSSPTSPLHIKSATDVNVRFDDSGSSSYTWYMNDAQNIYIPNVQLASTHTFYANGQRKVDIDASGNLLVGTTANFIATSTTATGLALTQDGRFTLSRSGTPMNIGRLGSDGSLIDFWRQGAPVGSIGANGGIVYVTGPLAGGLKYSNYDSTHASIFPCTTTGALADNLHDLGYSGGRFDNIWATNGTIQTSDRNEKQDIEELSSAETAVAVACKRLLRKFRWIDAVEKKGDDARIHFGIIAQDLQAAFAAEGLDAGRYAMFTSNTWWETQTEVEAVEAVEFVQAVEAVYDEDGELVSEAVEGVEAVEAKDAYTRTDTFQTLVDAPEGATERTRLGVRYPELLAFIIAAI